MATVGDEKKFESSVAKRVPLETALVARWYYLGGRQKSEIAQELGISRFKVARLLEEALTAGIVRIYVDMPTEMDLELGEEIRTRCGVRQVFVVKPLNTVPGTASDMMAGVAAGYLMNAVGPADVVGISWGSTVARVVDEIETLPAVDILQMVGGVRSSGLDTNGTELVRRLSQVSAGKPYPLMAPLIVDSTSTAQALRSDAAIAEVMGRYTQLTFALVGVGSWDPAQSSLLGELSPNDREEARAAGAVADVCGIILDQRGNPVATSVRSRTLSITFDELKRVPTVVAVAGGREKAHALVAAVRSGVIDVLVTDSVCARELVDLL